MYIGETNPAPLQFQTTGPSSIPSPQAAWVPSSAGVQFVANPQASLPMASQVAASQPATIVQYTETPSIPSFNQPSSPTPGMVNQAPTIITTAALMRSPTLPLLYTEPEASPYMRQAPDTMVQSQETKSTDNISPLALGGALLLLLLL